MSMNKRRYNWSNYTCNVDFVMFCTASMNRKAHSVCGKLHVYRCTLRKKGILSKGTNMFHLGNMLLKGTIIHPLVVNKVQKCTVWKKLLFYHKRWSTLSLCQDQKSHLTPQRTSGSHQEICSRFWRQLMSVHQTTIRNRLHKLYKMVICWGFWKGKSSPDLLWGDLN